MTPRRGSASSRSAVLSPGRGGMETHLRTSATSSATSWTWTCSSRTRARNGARKCRRRAIDACRQPAPRHVDAPGYLGDRPRARRINAPAAPNPMAGWRCSRAAAACEGGRHLALGRRPPACSPPYRPVSRRLLERADASASRPRTTSGPRPSCRLRGQVRTSFGVGLDALRPTAAIGARRTRRPRRPRRRSARLLQGVQVLLDAMAGLDATLVIAGEGDRRRRSRRGPGARWPTAFRSWASRRSPPALRACDVSCCRPRSGAKPSARAARGDGVREARGEHAARHQRRSVNAHGSPG
jgi:hypothetical protein